MPELPEVETYVRELEPSLNGRQIAGVTVRWDRTVAAPAPAEFARSLVGQTFIRFMRRGKYMLFGLSKTGEAQISSTLIVHLRMTGHLLHHAQAVPPDKHTHVLIDLVDGSQLHFQDSRKFGRMWWVSDPEAVLAKLGPEPLSEEFQPAAFAERLAKRTASIKALLLDQAIVAGVGNIYADESLHLAGINPQRQGGDLKQAEIAKLHQTIQQVLSQAIAGHGSSLGRSTVQNYQRPSGEQGSFQNQHRVFQRTGQPCPTCQTPIERIVLAQRSTHFCPICQPR